MEGMETAVLEQPVVESGAEQTQETTQVSAQDQQRQADKEYSNWLKGLKEDGDAGKFYKRLKGDHERLQELRRIDPKGLDGVRSRYETLNGIAHGDKTGIEAVQSIQEALAESQTMLDALAQGDISQLPEEHQDGVLRMAPSIIDHLADTNPEAYAALLTPHFWQAIESSPLAQYYSGMVEVLNEKPPEWLTKEQLPQWTLDHVGRITNMARGMGQWFTDLQKKAQGAADGKQATTTGTTAEKNTSGNPQFWQQSVYPQTNAHAEETFGKELRPWAEKLAKAGIRLSDAKKQALAQEMVQSVSSLAAKNQNYMAQMKRFNSQRSPDAASVISTFKSEFNRHAKSVLEGLIRRDYGQILEKGTKTVTKPATPGAKTVTSAQPGVKMVSIKPSRDRIDFQRTPTDWIYQNKWRMKDGSVVQYRP